jgi:hypothetical protein
MSKSNTTENDFQKYTFNATAISWNAAGTFYMALHTADPTDSGVQTASECAYTGYDRVAITRDAGGFTVTGNSVTNAAEITFPQCTGGTETATHWSIGLTDHPTGGQILYKGALTASLAISNLITPRIIAGALTITED